VSNAQSLIFWFVAYPWASLTIAYTLTAFALHLQGEARSVHEKELMWVAPIFWWVNTIWSFILGGTHSVPQRSALGLVSLVLLIVTVIAVVCLVRAMGRAPSQV
jgi:hypothetical protein